MRIKRDADKASRALNDPNRLAREGAKLDKLEERAFADFGTSSSTNWEKLRKMKDEEIDFSDSPEISSEMLANGIVRRGLKITSERRK
jgi:hypothetical protein